MINRTIKYGLLIVGLLSILVLSIILSNYSAMDTQKNTTDEYFQEVSSPLSSNEALYVQDNTAESVNKTTISISASLAYLNFTELNQRSESIVIGTVKEILPAKWNTPDGKRRGDTIENLGEYDAMYTDVIISVDQYLKNPLEQKEIRVRIQGGEDEVVKMAFGSEPSFKEGEKVLLYVSKDVSTMFKDFGPEHYLVIGASLGKFTLTDDGLAVREYEYVDQKELLDAIEKGYEPEIKSFEEVKE
ncbi:MAG: hypothetical protein A4E24_00847 [Methanomethylovorans sp. PtaU1.Bin093]|uniref:hypothetical protein n=1 Tax=Methanomethylovorans sp. PtaU1.Bin093 TaxID=1811679 RepID=UPI0009C8CD06|nr:hypothetical protein [Methanomethylovorans sp. PtaU1.Bin093]OPY21020.1 MAG: hypothetical protein A4E24_00847 [Methanomethylovorans sp. PtaU1.Bin093]